MTDRQPNRQQTDKETYVYIDRQQQSQTHTKTERLTDGQDGHTWRQILFYLFIFEIQQTYLHTQKKNTVNTK